MSKSLGNFFSVRDLIDQGYSGEVIRFVYLSTHYRKPMDWTEKKAKEAEATLRKWYGQAAQALDNSEPNRTVLDALADDLNTAGALAEMHQLSHADDVASLRASLRVLGLLNDGIPEWASDRDPLLGTLEAKMTVLRSKAMESKDFAAVDALKQALTDAGVSVRMSKEGVSLEPVGGFDASKLEGLV